jgi:hypothetical protein
MQRHVITVDYAERNFPSQPESDRSLKKDGTEKKTSKARMLPTLVDGMCKRCRRALAEGEEQAPDGNCLICAMCSDVFDTGIVFRIENMGYCQVTESTIIIPTVLRTEDTT